MPYANLTNPQTLNLYSMVADDPESFTDLDGHNVSCGAPNGPAGGADTCPEITRNQDAEASNTSPANNNQKNNKPPAQEKPQVAVIGTLDALHPAMTSQGKIQQQDVYYTAATVTRNEMDGFQIVEKKPDADVKMTETQTGGTDKLTICSKPCSVSGEGGPDQQHVSTVGGTATIPQTFTVGNDKKPALIIIIKPDGSAGNSGTDRAFSS